MDFTPGNTSLCLVLGAAAGNSSLPEVSKCWDCEEQHGFSDQLMGNCTECLENICTDFVANQNSQRTQTMVYVAAFMGVLMLLGIPGNILVLVVYYFKHEKTTANRFVMALAGIDLHACLIIHPYIILKCFYFFSPTTWVCKIFEYLLYVSQGSQGLMLTAVAVDRFYAVFKPLSFGYVENAVYMIPACLGVGAALSIPIILYYGQKTVWLYDKERKIHIRTSVCHYSDEYDGSRDQFIFVICTLLSMLLVLTTIIILYIMIAVKIKKRQAQVGPMGVAMVQLMNDTKDTVKQPPAVTSDTAVNQLKPIPDNSLAGLQNDQREKTASQKSGRKTKTTPLSRTSHDSVSRPNEIDLVTALKIQPVAHCSSSAPPIPEGLVTITVLPQSLNVPHAAPDQALRVRGTAPAQLAKNKPVGLKGCKLLFIVTAVFFLAWLPFWVLRFVKDEGDSFQKVWLTSALLNHLFFLNNAFNPILYVFINGKFREECKLTSKKISIRLTNMCC